MFFLSAITLVVLCTFFYLEFTSSKSDHSIPDEIDLPFDMYKDTNVHEHFIEMRNISRIWIYLLCAAATEGQLIDTLQLVNRLDLFPALLFPNYEPLANNTNTLLFVLKCMTLFLVLMHLIPILLLQFMRSFNSYRIISWFFSALTIPHSLVSPANCFINTF